jgi:hypothetical protein
MKKIFTSILMLFAAGAVHAQVLIKPVPYRGAFAPAPTPMWTDGWTNWDPGNTVYPALTVNVSGTITTNTIWTANNVYQLNGPVYVDTLITLTIEPGTIIRGNSAQANSSLIIQRGGKLFAQGTPVKPIIFTSNKAIGARAPGDWGGIILLGRADVNVPGKVANIEGLPVDPKNTYGGGVLPDDNDNSGALQYIRIEFAGYVFQENREINGLTMGAVGRKTVIDHIQTSFTNDDAFEWFGGTVSATHLVSYRDVDDNFDSDFGWRGNVQFGLAVRDPDLADPTHSASSNASTSEGFESDNDAQGSTNTPQTAGIFSNITIIGPYRGTINNGPIHPGFRRAVRLRRNTALKIFNSVFMDYPRGLMIDGSPAELNATNGLLKFKNNIIAGSENTSSRYFERSTNPASTYDVRGFFFANANDSLPTSANILITPYNYLLPDYRPTANSIALTNWDFTDPSLTGVLQTCVLEKPGYRGAFAPAPTPMWTDGWTNWDPGNTVYPALTVNVSGTITTNTIWTANNVYQLNGPVYVDTLITLTIEPGTIIRGNSAQANSSLIIQRGGKLFAQGTPVKPIIFTSNKAIGARAPGDWGGIILLGRADVNVPGKVANIEGLPVDPKNTYGGGVLPDDNDNSGALQYIRIEFAGYVFQENREINGLTMGAVGRKTVIDHIQTSFTNDDAFEWFGGTVSATHLVSYRDVDDNFDSDFGWRGNVQFGLAVRDPDLADPTHSASSNASTSEGFESDNDAQGSTNTPQTAGIFSNITIIGPYRGTINNGPIHPGFRRAVRLRRNTALKIFNSVFMDYPRGLMIDGSPAELNATNGLLKFKNNIIAGSENTSSRYFERSTNPASTYDVRGFFFANANDSFPTSAGILITPYNYLNPDYRPSSGSPALSNINTTDAAFTTCSDFALPVTLSELKGIHEKGTNFLTWKTVTEQNNAGFEIERSANGQQFSNVGYVRTLAVNGNSNATLSYNFEDVKPIPGVNFYRLKQKDTDGRFAYSNVIVLNTNNVDVLTIGHVYPNPANLGVVRMVVVSPEAQEVNFRISDVSGRIVNQRDVQLNQGINNLEWNVRGFGAGSYFIQAVGTGIKPQKFIKQ